MFDFEHELKRKQYWPDANDQHVDVTARTSAVINMVGCCVGAKMVPCERPL